MRLPWGHAEVMTPSPEMQLWKQYVDAEVGSEKIQPECMPRIVRADPVVGRRGMLMFFHSDSDCPQQGV
ncbi:MAG TPA: hypothetical protein VE954_09700 [Oligoflexus sp.]|uniref:hypothetical protein n=1 Tax=Oligoflexus sp. TaxID=1971216 RepID=UPI002D3E117D|nr:hypothetical protein [Oligoflexus sp.]HYX33376.1 hypothetical protein [Oligoflexus sp.]